MRSITWNLGNHLSICFQAQGNQEKPVDLKLNLVFIRVKSVCNANPRTKWDTCYMSNTPLYSFQDKNTEPWLH